jgi:hypothetical protein
MPTQAPQDPTQGVLGGLSRVKRDGAHSLQELQEFVAQMRGRSPQEVLGMVSASELVRGIVLATVGCVVLLAAFTVVPYALRDKDAAAKASAAPAAPTKTAGPSTATTPAIASTDEKTDKTPDASAAAKALNIDEVKTADPSVNPLDKDLDKLLDGN